MSRCKLIMSHLAVAAISGTLAIWFWNLHLAAESGGYTTSERRFLVAFDRSVSECEADRSVGYVDYAIDAAENCTTPRAIRMVEEHCYRALGSRVGMGCHVAFYVLLESTRAVRPQTLDVIKQMAEQRVEGTVERGDLEYLIRELEKKNHPEPHL